MATTITGAGGAFDFRLRPDRDTRYRVSASGLPAHAQATFDVAVAGKVVVKLAVGRTGALRPRRRRGPAERALADPGAPSGCTGRGFTGAGSLPAGYPQAGAVARAERALVSRGGRTALAVVDTEGRLAGHHRVFSLAIMTDGDPSMDYGIQTLDIVTRALL